MCRNPETHDRFGDVFTAYNLNPLGHIGEKNSLWLLYKITKIQDYLTFNDCLPTNLHAKESGDVLYNAQMLNSQDSHLKDRQGKK